jgi:hypothetical protein
MSDLPKVLLAHLQREARDARDRAREPREETERQIPTSYQQLDEGLSLLRCLKILN